MLELGDLGGFGYPVDGEINEERVCTREPWPEIRDGSPYQYFQGK